MFHYYFDMILAAPKGGGSLLTRCQQFKKMKIGITIYYIWFYHYLCG